MSVAVTTMPFLMRSVDMGSPARLTRRVLRAAILLYSHVFPKKLGESHMPVQLSTTFTGLRFENPFLLSSAPPTESDSNIMRAFDAGWGGVITKTIGLHPVVNVKGPKTKFLRADNSGYRL